MDDATYDRLEAAVHARIDDVRFLRAASDAKLAEARAHRWRLLRNSRLMREARVMGWRVDVLIAANARDLRMMRNG